MEDWLGRRFDARRAQVVAVSAPVLSATGRTHSGLWQDPTGSAAQDDGAGGAADLDRGDGGQLREAQRQGDDDRICHRVCRKPCGRTVGRGGRRDEAQAQDTVRIGTQPVAGLRTLRDQFGRMISLCWGEAAHDQKPPLGQRLPVRGQDLRDAGARVGGLEIAARAMPMLITKLRSCGVSSQSS